MIAGQPTTRFFFIHLMKTGGATFRQHVYANYGRGEVYPYRTFDPDMHSANYDIAYLLRLPSERRDAIVAYTGHFPFVVTEMMGLDLVTLTMLRDPVSRTISYLKHCKRYHEQHRDLTLDEIYDDEFFFKCFVQNHQSKVFAMTRDDKLESYMDWIDVDEVRLEIAKANLEKVDLVGLNEYYDEFVADAALRFGWRFDDLPSKRVGDEPWSVSDELRRRIASDNAADVDFYEFARELYAARQRARSVR